MAEKENSEEIDFEMEISDRIDELIAIKKKENEQAIGRLNTMETAWQDVNTELDTELIAEIDLLDDEAQAIDEAKNRLIRNPCAGVDKKSLGIAGKVVETDTKIGLPGLTVTISIAQAASGNELLEETRTDSYGNFSAAIPIDRLNPSGTKKSMLVFVVSTDPKTVVHTEEIQVAPKGGKIEQVILTVPCTEPLKDALEYGKRVNESVESDEVLFNLRSVNMNEAHTAFSRLPGNTLIRIQALRDELSTGVPGLGVVKTFAMTPSEPEKKKKTRYLGNTSTHELHDLKNEKKNCRIDQIRFDHWINFKTQKEATEADYDFCAYCFGKEKSKR